MKTIFIITFVSFLNTFSFSQTKVDSMKLKNNCIIKTDTYKLDYLYNKFSERISFRSLKHYGYGGNFYISTVEDMDMELGLKMRQNCCSMYAINFSLNDSVGDQNFGIIELSIDTKYAAELEKRLSKCNCYSLNSESPFYFEILVLPNGETYIVYSDTLEHDHAYFKETINYLKTSN